MKKPAVLGRVTAQVPPGTVIFLIGVRFNRPWKVHKWVPVFMAMPKMLKELREHPELGMMKANTYLSGLTLMTVQYWTNAEALNAYATNSQQTHLPAWRRFNQKVRTNGDVGVFHETYIIGGYETLYVNMPATFGLGGAGTVENPARRGQRAAHRLDPSQHDTPTVQPYE